MSIELSQDRSDALVAANFDMLLALVKLRRASGIRQEDVAAALGITQQAVSQFERLERDPHLSTVAQYANAVGALISHSVTSDTGASSRESGWWTMNVEFAGRTQAATRSVGFAFEATIESKRTDFAIAA